MISHAINSGAINAVPFPSSEQGTSVIELIGTVEVTGAVSNLKTRFYAEATTTAKASTSSPPVRFKAQLGATAQPGAVQADITAQHKTQYSGSGFCSAATSSPSAVIKRRMAAGAQAAAATSASSYLRVARSASTSAAAYGYQGAFTVIRVAATAAPQAVARDATARAKVLRSATQSGQAASIASMRIKTRVGATAQAAISATATTGARVSRSASVQPTANGIAGAYRRVPTGATTAAAGIGVSGVRSSLATSAATQAFANPNFPNAAYQRVASAYVVAAAIPSVVAYDFATEIPAPLDRQIVVPPYDRTMKVVA